MDRARVEHRSLPFHFLEEITCGFSEERKLGVGAFGSVYKGHCKDGEIIAVKMLHSMPRLNGQQFQKEYFNVASLNHQNIVRLIGYCNETRREYVEHEGRTILVEREHMALCFEYMSNGSLDNCLQDESSGHDWNTRYTIIKGICKGLKYLHELNPPFYHLDLKPGNILLDAKMTPKIADFGLSKICGEEQTQVTASIIGTLGYLPPEYIQHNLVSNKLDIFSLGVIIIKIMTGHAGYYESVDMSSEEFIDLVHENWRIRLQRESTDGIDSSAELVKTCTKIALNCVDADRHKRPKIGDIVRELDEAEIMTQFSQVLALNPGSTSLDEQLTRSGITKIICRVHPEGELTQIDVHPTEPWVLASYHVGGVAVWNYKTQKRVTALETPGTTNKIRCVKFIARKDWFLAGDWDGWIHVRACVTNDEVTKFKAHERVVISMAVHPSDPLLLSSGSDSHIKLWNWEADWKCIRQFKGHSEHVEKVVFNPIDSNFFASVGLDNTLKIWKTSSPIPVTTLDCHEHQLTVDYFHPTSDVQCIVTGSVSGKARVWNLETNTCEGQLKGLLQADYSRCVGVVDCFPGPSVVITTLVGNVISVYNFDTDGNENLVDFKLGRVCNLAYVKDMKSVMIGFSGGIAMMEINPEDTMKKSPIRDAHGRIVEEKTLE